MLSLLLPRASLRWFGSEFSELPVIDPQEDQALLDYRLLEGGLALVLSRCSTRGAEREFRASLAAYRSLKRQLRRGRGVHLGCELLSEVAHEIAVVADAATRAAARRCLERSRQAAAGAS